MVSAIKEFFTDVRFNWFLISLSLIFVILLIMLIRQRVRRRSLHFKPSDVRVNPTELKAITNEEFLASLKRICANLEYADTHVIFSALNEIQSAIQSPLLVTVLGEFSSGKSSFINALLEQDLLATSIRPTTATITVIHLGDSETINIEYMDGSKEYYPRERLEEFTASRYVDDKSIANRVFKADIETTHPILEKIDLADTPGFNSGYEHHTEITEAFLKRSDIVFWVLDPLHIDKRTTQALINKYRTFTRPYGVINKLDHLRAQMDNEGEVENHIITIENELRDVFKDIFFVSAKEDLLGIKESSGITGVRNYVANTLVPEAETLKERIVRSKLLETWKLVEKVLESYDGKLAEFKHIISERELLCKRITGETKCLQQSYIRRQEDIDAYNAKKITDTQILDRISRWFVGTDMPVRLADKASRCRCRLSSLQVEVSRLNSELDRLNSRQAALESEWYQLNLKWDEYNSKGWGLKRWFDDAIGWGTNERQELNARSAKWDSDAAKLNHATHIHNNKVEVVNSNLYAENRNLLNILNLDVMEVYRKKEEIIDSLTLQSKKMQKELKKLRPRYERILGELEMFSKNTCRLYISLQIGIDGRSKSVELLRDNRKISCSMLLDHLRAELNSYKGQFGSREVYTQTHLSKELSNARTNAILREERKAVTKDSYRSGETAPKFA